MSGRAKTVTVSLQPNGNGYTVGPQNTAAVTIGPDLGTPTGPVGRAAAPADAGRRHPALVDPIGQRQDARGPARASSSSSPTATSTRTIAYEVAIGGNATANDVVAPAGKITFPAGVRQVPLNIPTVADGVSEADEELQVTIVDGDTYDLGDNPTARRSISSG